MGRTRLISIVSASIPFRRASVSKSITAVAVLQLVEKGVLQLDAKLESFLANASSRKWLQSVIYQAQQLAQKDIFSALIRPDTYPSRSIVTD